MNDQYENEDSKSENNASAGKSTSENLIHLSDKNMVSNTSDLNSRLNEIESELRHLNAREAATNKSFRELLSETKRHTSEQDVQLEETRDQISDIKDKYRKLTQDYQRLAAGSNILSVTLEQARSEITNDIETLRRSTSERVDQLADGQLQMIERAKRIEHKASQMAEDLESRINVIRTTISALESKLIAEIREMAEQSEQRDEALMIRTNMIEEALAEETEKLRQADAELSEKISEVALQSEQRDDSLLIRTNMIEETLTQETESLRERASSLEARSTQMANDVEDLQFQANNLDTRADDLETRSDELEEITEIHSAKLAQANETIDRHHKGFAIAMVLIVLTIGTLSILQQNRWHDTTEADSQMQSQLAEQSTSLTTQAALQQQNSSRIDVLETQSQASHDQLIISDEKITAALDQQQQQISELQDSITSLQVTTDNNANRMTAMSPYKTFGQDNTIHPASWLAQQDKQQYVVKVMTANSKQALYSAAYRWSNLFNDSKLSYIETQQSGKTLYTLIYGTFADRQQAEMISRRLPVMDFDSRPVATQLSELL